MHVRIGRASATAQSRKRDCMLRDCTVAQTAISRSRKRDCTVSQARLRAPRTKMEQQKIKAQQMGSRSYEYLLKNGLRRLSHKNGE